MTMRLSMSSLAGIGADAGRGRDGEAGLHVGDDAGGRTLEAVDRVVAACAGGALGTGVAPGAGISVVRVGVPAEDAVAGGAVGSLRGAGRPARPSGRRRRSVRSVPGQPAGPSGSAPAASRPFAGALLAVAEPFSGPPAASVGW